MARRRVQERLGLDEAAAATVVRDSFRSLARNVLESTLPSRPALWADVRSWVTVEGASHARAALDSEHGVLFCSGHIGSWELFPALMAEFFEPIWMVVRPVDNPHVEAWLKKHTRQWASRGSVPKDGGGRQLARIMKAGEPLAVLLDQRARSEGVVLPFLGAPASQFKTAGVLARRFGALVVPWYVLREPDGLHYRLVFEPAIEVDPTRPAREAEIDVVARLSRSLERQVRSHPGQWLWIHDRWKAAGRGEVVPLAQSIGEDRNSPSPRMAQEGTNGS